MILCPIHENLSHNAKVIRKKTNTAKLTARTLSHLLFFCMSERGKPSEIPSFVCIFMLSPFVL